MPVNKQIVGIQVHYCVNGQKKPPVWVDLDQVQALAWTTDDVAEKKNPGNGQMPESSASKACPPRTSGDKGQDPTVQTTGGPICWWDGRRWVCGDLT